MNPIPFALVALAWELLDEVDVGRPRAGALVVAKELLDVVAPPSY